MKTTIENLSYEDLRQKVIDLCNKYAGLEVPYSELENREWLGELGKDSDRNDRCFHPIFSLESKDVTLQGGEKRTIYTKCILLSGIKSYELDSLCGDESHLKELYDFIINRTRFSVKKWIKAHWEFLITLGISVAALIVSICSCVQSNEVKITKPVKVQIEQTAPQNQSESTVPENANVVVVTESL